MTADVANPEALGHVRAGVERILRDTPAYWQLPEEDRRALAFNMVKAGAFISGAATGDVPAEAAVGEGPALAHGLAVPAPAPRRPYSYAQASPGSQGGDEFASVIQKVDFPKFVAGLIDGVFNAIVSASIKQMEAYAELLKNVSKSVDEYMKDNVTDNQARDYLAGQYPEHLELDTTSETPQVKPKADADEDSLPDFLKDLGLGGPVDSLDEKTPEEVLVPAARKKIAMDRQQLLATMVLMGINRLIVTDGTINASVLFELDTEQSDTRTREHTYTEDGKKNSTSFSWGNRMFDISNKASTFKVSTTNTNTTTDKIDLHAKLTGAVNVRFRSETFPLERMADIIGVQTPQQRAAETPAPAK